jgi:hypothetical protein
MLPTLPVEQGGVKPLAVKTLPYALSQIWSTTTPPSLAGVWLVTVTWYVTVPPSLFAPKSQDVL